jgi:DNA-binding MarR family transcriptional regulator
VKDVVGELVAICRVFGVFERAAVCCGTVTVPQCVALQALLGGNHDVGRLAAHMGVSASAMTRLVDGLERRGWVRRVRGDDDRRRVDLELTAEGRREAARLRELTEKGVAAVLAHLPRGRHVQVLESLRLLRAALEQAREAVTCCGAPVADE